MQSETIRLHSGNMLDDMLCKRTLGTLTVYQAK